MTSEKWSVNQDVAQRIQAIRKTRSISRAALAKRCTQLGVDISHSSLRNIESGRPGADGDRRRNITIDELFVLAEALGVSPLSLLFPLEEFSPDSVVEILPGRIMNLGAAVGWFTARPTSTTDPRKTPPGTNPWSVGEHRVSFLGELDPGRDKRDPRSLVQPRTQAPLGGVSKFQIDASGTWFTAVDAETGQVSMIRILPETTLIVIDKS